MYNEEMIENVREYLNDNNDVAIDCIQSLGDGDWTNTYSLYELYQDYCNGELDEVINLFVASGEDAYAYNYYFVNQDGEVCDDDDLCYAIEEYLEDDDIIESIIEDINNWNVNVPDDLLELCKESATLEDVQTSVSSAYRKLLQHKRNMLGEVQDLDYFRDVCDSTTRLMRIYASIMRIAEKCSENDINILNEMVWENTIPNIEVFTCTFCKGGITIEKAVEVWLNNNVLEG